MSRDKIIFWSGMAVFVLLYFVFYPPIYAFRDEASYLSMAQLLKKGKLFIDEAGVPFQSWITAGGRKVFDYPLGMPLLLLPFTFFGWQAVFLAAFLCHLAGTLYFRKILKIFKIENEALALLYLFFPPFLFYSRTLMSDVPAAAFFLAGVYHHFKSGRADWKGGIFFSLSLFFRPGGLVFILPFIFRKSFLFFLPLALWAGLTGWIQMVFYGSPFISGYSPEFSGFHSFSPVYFLPNLGHYLISLLICYPFMLLAPGAALKTRRTEILFSCFSGLIFYSFYFFHDQFQNYFQTTVFGSRFIFPALALFLLMYAEVLNDTLEKRLFLKEAGGAWIFPVILSLSAFIIHAKHQEALKPQLALKKVIYDSTPEGSILIYDILTAELMQEAWGSRTYLDLRSAEHGLSKFLRSSDLKRGIYLITRNAQGEDRGLEDSAPLEWPEIKKYFDLKLIAKHEKMEIFKFDERSS